MDDVCLRQFSGQSLPCLAVGRSFEDGVVKVVYVIHRIASLQNLHLSNLTHSSKVGTNPVTRLLASSIMVESGGVVVEHQLVLCCSESGV